MCHCLCLPKELPFSNSHFYSLSACVMNESMISFFFLHPKIEQVTKRKHEIEKIWGNVLWNNYMHDISRHFMVEDSGRANLALSVCGSIGWYVLVAQAIRVLPDVFFPLWQQLALNSALGHPQKSKELP